MWIMYDVPFVGPVRRCFGRGRDDLVLARRGEERRGEERRGELDPGEDTVQHTRDAPGERPGMGISYILYMRPLFLHSTSVSLRDLCSLLCNCIVLLSSRITVLHVSLCF
jgi:hypothetical protein